MRDRQDDAVADRRVDDLLGWLREYAAIRINSYLIDSRRSIPPHIVLDFGNSGLLGMTVPDRYGGLGLRTSDVVRTLVQLGAIDLTLALFVGNNNALGVHPIAAHGSPALRDELLPVLGSGRELAAFALTEPGAGSNPRAICSRARYDGIGGWTIHGSKLFIGSASWSGVINVFAQAEDADGQPRGLTGFAIRQGARGLRLGPEAMTMGMRGMVQNAISLDGVRAETESLLGHLGDGFAVMQDAMQLGRLGLGATSLGGMMRCAQLMARYSARRPISTGRLLEDTVWLSRFSDLSAAISSLRALVVLTASLLEGDGGVPAEVCMACKTIGSELLWSAADLAVQTLGGRGYLEQNGCAQILRDARVFRIFEGPTEALRMFMGARVLQGGAELDRFLREILHVPGLATQLSDRVAAVRERSESQGRGPDRAASYQWACQWIGQLVEWALLAAAVQSALDRMPSPERTRSLAWVQGRVDGVYARALADAEDRPVTAGAVEEIVRSYVLDIGDIEQHLPGEDTSFDELLRRPDGTAADRS